MAADKWNEEGKIWEDDHGLLDDEQIAQCARADEGEPFHSPSPHADDLERRVHAGRPDREAEAGRSADRGTRRIRRARSSGSTGGDFSPAPGGMAAAFLAMNEVFGRFFDVDPIEMFEPAAYAQSGAPRDLFVFDDQLHLVRGSSAQRGAALRALAQGPVGAGVQSRIRLTRKAVATSAAKPGASGIRAGRPADVAGELSDRAVHQGRLSRQPGDHRAAEQRHGLGGQSASGAAPRSAAKHRGSAARRDADGGADRRRAQLRQRDFRIHAHAGPRPALRRQGQPAYIQEQTDRTSPIRGRATTSRTRPRSTTIRSA